MKTLVLCIFGIILVSLKPSDYRDLYCGSYSVKRTFRYLNEQKTGFLYNVSSYTIAVSKSVVDSSISITTKEGAYTVKVSSGIFRNDQTKVFGNFSNDSIYFERIPSLAPLFYRYIGKK
jgi:hypothetical protein